MSHHRYGCAVCWSICLSSALPAYSFNLIFISLKSSPIIFCSVCRRSASILSLICVFLQPSSSRRSYVPPQVQPHCMVTECLYPQLPVSSAPTYVLLLPSFYSADPISHPSSVLDTDAVRTVFPQPPPPCIPLPPADPIFPCSCAVWSHNDYRDRSISRH